MNVEKSKESTSEYQWEKIFGVNSNWFLAEEKKEQDDSLSQPTSIFVTTINPDSSVTEEKKTITPSASKNEPTPLTEHKSQWTFILLISSQGQEVLKSKDLFLVSSMILMVRLF